MLVVIFLPETLMQSFTVCVMIGVSTDISLFSVLSVYFVYIFSFLFVYRVYDFHNKKNNNNSPVAAAAADTAGCPQ